MFKLVVLSALVAVAVARPEPHAVLGAPAVVGSLISEKTIESHGNTVVHATAPVLHAEPAAIAYAAAPVAPIVRAVHAVQPAHLVSEKTIEAHGNTVVHSSAPAAVLSYAAVPAVKYAAIPAVKYAAIPSIKYAEIPTVKYAPALPAATLISEKSVSGYGHSIVHQGSPLVHTSVAHAAPILTYSATYGQPAALSVW